MVKKPVRIFWLSWGALTLGCLICVGFMTVIGGAFYTPLQSLTPLYWMLLLPFPVFMVALSLFAPDVRIQAGSTTQPLLILVFSGLFMFTCSLVSSVAQPKVAGGTALSTVIGGSILLCALVLLFRKRRNRPAG